MHHIVRLVESNCARNCLVCFLQLITPPIPQCEGSAFIDHSVYSHHPHVVHASLHGNPVSDAGMSIVLLGLHFKISSTFSTITISSVDQLPSIMSSARLNCKNFKHLWHHHHLLCGSIAIHHELMLNICS